MRTILISLLLVALVFSAKTNVSKATQKKIADLASTRYGKTLLNFAQLHAAVEGPIDELLQAIQELLDDLNVELQELEFNFQRRTNEHNSLVVQYEQEIGDAEQDVARMDDVITNLLVPRRDQIYNRMQQIGENMEFNRKSLREETMLREQDHEAYEAAVAEYNEAIEAVDEAIALLGTLLNGGGESLIQVRKITKSMEKLQKNISKKMKNAPFIQAMIALAINQNFSDQGLLGNIVNALNEFRNECVDAINALSAQEAQDVAAYEARVQQLDLEYADFQASLADATVDYDATVQKIAECYDFLNAREADRKQYVAQLELENETYVQETEIYTDLKNQYLRELAVTEQAFSLVDSADFGSSVDFGK